MPSIDWKVHVIHSQEKNAFVLPGGKIFVFTGILPTVQDEDGMAAVLSHEIAHQVARHIAEKNSWVSLLMYIRLALALVFDFQLINSRVLLEYGLMRPFSRKLESEADYIGLLLMAKACYDPSAAIGLWERMAESSPNFMKYLSTHPTNEKRIQDIREWLPEALEIKNNNQECNQLSWFKKVNFF